MSNSEWKLEPPKPGDIEAATKRGEEASFRIAGDFIHYKCGGIVDWFEPINYYYLGAYGKCRLCGKIVGKKPGIEEEYLDE